MTERTELPKLATRAEVAESLRVSTRTVDRLIAAGKLTAVRPTGRGVKITVASIEALASGDGGEK